MIWVAVGLCLGVALLGALVGVLATSLRARSEAEERAAAAEAAAAEVRERLEALERRVATTQPHPITTETEFVITRLGEEPAEPDRLPAPVRLTVPAFADAILRETVVHTVALAAGVRRALDPEVRNRVRFEVRRELKRARKARRVEVREALREYRAKHRADVPVDAA